MGKKLTATCVTLGLAMTLPALAQERENYADSTAAGAGVVESPRSLAKDWMIMPRGQYTLGADIIFLSADEGVIGPELKVTDFVMLGLRARYAIARRAELVLGTTILPKQPSYTDETIWQNSSVGVRIGMGDRYAIAVGGSAGSLMNDGGKWGSASVALEARKSIHRTAFFQGKLGAAATALRLDDDSDREFAFAETLVAGNIVFRAPGGQAATWFGTEFRFPIADDPEHVDDMTGFFIDAKTSASIHLGAVLSYIDDWDIFTKVVYIDNGDIGVPGTTLPILDGGFDQLQWMIGVTRRFRDDDYQRAFISE